MILFEASHVLFRMLNLVYQKQRPGQGNTWQAPTNPVLLKDFASGPYSDLIFRKAKPTWNRCNALEI